MLSYIYILTFIEPGIENRRYLGVDCAPLSDMIEKIQKAEARVKQAM
jgi:hypothetical protein